MEKRGVITGKTPAETNADEYARKKLAADESVSQADVARIEAGPTRRLIDAVSSQVRRNKHERPG